MPIGDVAISPEDVLRFWFGEPGDPPLAKASSWFQRSDAFDAQIRERFGATLERAARGELDTWRTTPRGRLALVVLLDQFSRNVFRGTPGAFAQDALALAVAEQALAAGDAAVLSPTELQFLLMPLMHAEDPSAQHRCVEGFEAQRDAAPAALRDAAEGALRYARMHADIIVRFGRFPHRNAILGRPSTAEEEEFLTQSNSSF